MTRPELWGYADKGEREDAQTDHTDAQLALDEDMPPPAPEATYRDGFMDGYRYAMQATRSAAAPTAGPDGAD